VPDQAGYEGDAGAYEGGTYSEDGAYYEDGSYYEGEAYPEDDLDYFDEQPPPGLPAGLKLLGVIVLLLVVGAALLVGARLLADLASPDQEDPITSGVEVAIEIPQGASARSIGTLLADRSVIASASDFEKAVRDAGAASQLKAGAYVVVTGTPLEDIVAQLTLGPPAADTFRVTVIEGLRIEEMLQSLADQTAFDFVDFAEPLRSGEIQSSLLPEDVPSDDRAGLIGWEGLLAPDTYEFVTDATPGDILSTMASTLERRVEGMDWSDLETLGYTPYEGLVIASLIEKEAKLDEDRPLISSVIANRLDRGMALQIDATIIYALGTNPGRVLLRDLEIDSPYNTYRYPGLPPTPIGGIRSASLEAAANPASTEYLYYVLVDPSGAHGFSETLDEHNQKKAKAKADGVIP
jgi:UPF0755 protein